VPAFKFWRSFALVWLSWHSADVSLRSQALCPSVQIFSAKELFLPEKGLSYDYLRSKQVRCPKAPAALTRLRFFV
jgi:hypothetical protein